MQTDCIVPREHSGENRAEMNKQLARIVLQERGFHGTRDRQVTQGSSIYLNFARVVATRALFRRERRFASRVRLFAPGGK